MAKRKRANNDLQNITQKTKDLATRTSQLQSHVIIFKTNVFILGDYSRFWLSCLGSLVFFLPKIFKLFGFHISWLWAYTWFFQKHIVHTAFDTWYSFTEIYMHVVYDRDKIPREDYRISYSGYIKWKKFTN